MLLFWPKFNFIWILIQIFVYTDWFKSDGWEESIDHKVDFLSQVRHTEVLQQSFFAAQTVDQHTESQPTQTQRHFGSCTNI